MFSMANSDNPLDSLFKIPSFQLYDDQNPISQHDDTPFFSNFPSPFFDEHELPLNQILPKNLLMAGNRLESDHLTDRSTEKDSTKRSIGVPEFKGKADDRPISNGLVAPLRKRSLGVVVPRKRTAKKDRHSKICTAQGIRDRRMRLSLQVARKFFDLQDMLGYDKASKTIEWLFNKSKNAIKELIKDSNPQGNFISMSDAKTKSFLFECEVVSGINQEDSNIEVTEGIVPNNESPLCLKTRVEDEKKSRRTVCKPNTRESREKARARARCRTREKLMSKGVENSSPWLESSPNRNDLQKLGSSNSPFEPGIDHREAGSPNLERVCSYGAEYSSPTLVQRIADEGTIEKLPGASGLSTSCPISDNCCCSAAVSCLIDPNSNFLGFLGNWDLLNSNRIGSVTNQVPLAGNPNSF